MLVCPPITCQFVHFTRPIAPQTIHKCIELCLLCSVLVRTIVSSVLLRTSSYEAFRAKLVRPVHNSFDIPDNTVSHPVVFDRVASSIKIYMRNESLFHQTISCKVDIDYRCFPLNHGVKHIVLGLAFTSRVVISGFGLSFWDSGYNSSTHSGFGNYYCAINLGAPFCFTYIALLNFAILCFHKKSSGVVSHCIPCCFCSHCPALLLFLFVEEGVFRLEYAANAPTCLPFTTSIVIWLSELSVVCVNICFAMLVVNNTWVTTECVLMVLSMKMNEEEDKHYCCTGVHHMV